MDSTTAGGGFTPVALPARVWAGPFPVSIDPKLFQTDIRDILTENACYETIRISPH